MCGRYAIYGPVSRKNRNTIEFLGEELEFAPRYNAAPTQLLPVYREHPERGRELATLRVLGFRTGEVSYMLLGEAALLVLLALPIGALLGWFPTRGIARGPVPA